MARSNATVSSYMRKLDASEWLEDPRLQVIERGAQEGSEKASRFTLRVRQSRPKRRNGTES